MNLVVLFLLAQVAPVTSASTTVVGFNWPGLFDFLWHLANSPLGVVFVGGAVVHLLGWIFTKQPKYAKLFEEHKGILFDAVRFAEAQVPEGTPGSASAKMKAALQYVEKLEHPILDAANEGDLKRAIELAHAAEVHPDQAITVPVKTAAAPTSPQKVV